METKSKFLLFALIILLVGLGAVSAAENTTDTTQTTDTTPGNEITTDVMDTSDNLIQDRTTSNVKTSNNKTIEKNKEKETTVKEARTITIASSAGITNLFFNSTGTTNMISEGDTINLKGTFTNTNFYIDKPITLTSLDNDATLTNCMVMIYTSGSGSTISNLVIRNDAEGVTGIAINCANNILVENNDVRVRGTKAHAFDAITNRSVIRSNYFETIDTEVPDGRVHTAMVFSNSMYNIIANNTAYSEAANVIYLSSYPGQTGLGPAGLSNYNNITGNNLTGGNSGWCYTIQMMGSNNIASYNTVSGGYHGIDSGGYNNTIEYNDVSGWARGITTTRNTIVRNNNIHVINSSVGILVTEDNAQIINNTISTENGNAIEFSVNNVTIDGNEITTQSYGIYGKPSTKNPISPVNILNNKITSNKKGIYFTNSGYSGYINNITVDNNHIISQADYAIDFKNAGSNVASQVHVTVTSSNILISNKGTGNVAYLPPAKNPNGTAELDSNQIININSTDVYNKYFDGNGNARTNETKLGEDGWVKQNATVYINTTLNNVNLKFTKKVHVIGQNGKINNGTITLSDNAHASTITGVKINNTKDEYNVHGIEVLGVNNCNITNNVIENYARYESFAIFLYSSGATTITGNNLKTSGDYVNDAIMLYDASTNTIEKNIIHINQSNVPLEYAESIQFDDEIGTIQEVLHNHGIILLYSSNNNINNNTVTSKSMFNTYTAPTSKCKNSIVGIDVYFDSHNNKVTNNKINLDSYGPYTYGMGVLGAQWGKDLDDLNSKNNLFQNNNVTVKGGYFTTGFIAGRNSQNTTLDSNTFNIESRKNTTTKGDYAYGITLENSTTSTVTNNKVTSTGAAVYSIEIFSSPNNTITQNTITAKGSYPYGIAADATENNKIYNNTITITKQGSDEVNPIGHSDAIPLGDNGIYLMYESKNNDIRYNTIKTNTDSTVRLTNATSNNNVIENSLTAKSSVGDQSVNNQHSSNTVKNNFVYFTNVTVGPAYAMIGDQIVLNATVDTTTTDTRNLTAYFRIGTTNIGNSSVVNGKASLSYRVPVFFNPTTYQLTVNVIGTNFQNATGINSITLSKGPEEVNVNVAKVLSTVGSNATLTASIITSTGGKIGLGQAEFYVNNVKIGTVDVKLGNASIVYPISANENPAVKTIKVKYLGTADYKPAEGNNTLGIQSKSSVSVADATGKLGEYVTIVANVTSGGKAVNGGIARIYIGSHNIANATIVNGKVSYKYTIPNSFATNAYNLQVAYTGNDTQTSASKTGKITINPYTTVFGYNTTVVAVGSSVSLVLSVDNGKTGNAYYAANDGNVTLMLNGKTLTDSSGKAISGIVKDGQLEFKFTAPAQLVGSQNLTFCYSGNSKFSPLNKTYAGGLVIEEGILSTKLNLDTIKTVQYKENITITGKLTDSANKAIKNANINVTINNESYLVTTNAQGVFSYKTNASVTGVNNVTAKYAGTTGYHASNDKTTFTVEKQDFKITINKIADVFYGHNVTITGTLTDGLGDVRANSALRILINGKSVSTRTDANGKFSVESKVGVIGTNNVTVIRSGDNNYNAANASSTFKMVKQNLIITVDKIANVVYGSSVKITGTLKDGDGNIRANTGVKLLINGKSATAKTDKNGKYTFTTKIGKLGVNNVTVSHAGGANYNPASASTTYTVVKQDLKITLDPIGTVTYGSVTIKGLFTDSKNNPRANTGLKISINGKTATVKTDANGKFTLTSKVGVIGVNNVTAYHNGGGNYNPTNTSITFTMKKQDLKVTIDPIKDVTYGNSVVITGTFTDASGKIRANSAIKIIINGKTLTTRTDANGKFKATSKVGSIGINNVTVSHNGGTGFNPTSTSTTFKMVKQDLKITINAINNVKKGNKVTVTGTFTDANGKIRANTNLKVNLNGVEYTTKTDTKGAFTFSTTVNKVGTNTITISHTGGANYNPTNSTKTFTVTN